MCQNNTRGFDRLQFGASYAIPNSLGGITAFGRLALNTGSGLYSNQGTETTLGINIDKVLRPAFIYGGLNWRHNWLNNMNTFGWTVGLGLSLNERLSVGSEVVGTYLVNDPTISSRQSHQVNARVSWLVDEDLSLSTTIGLGVSGNAPDFGIRMGIERRF